MEYNFTLAASLEHNCGDDCADSITLVSATDRLMLPAVPLVGGSPQHKQAMVEQINEFIRASSLPALYTAESGFGPQAVVFGLALLISLAILVHRTWRLIASKSQRAPG